MAWGSEQSWSVGCDVPETMGRPRQMTPTRREPAGSVTEWQVARYSFWVSVDTRKEVRKQASAGREGGP